MHDLKLEGEAPAVKALGSRFKLTEVLLWDDASGSSVEERSFREFTGSLHDDETSPYTISSTTDCSPLPVEVELARQMSALGLPLSFQTNKERRNGRIKGKRTDMNKNHFHGHEGSDDGVLDSVTANVSTTQCLSVEGQDSANLTKKITFAAVEEQTCDGASGILSNYGQENGSLHNNVLSEETMKTEVSPTNSDADTSRGSIILDDEINRHKQVQDEQLMEFTCMERSSVVDDESEDKKFCSDPHLERQQGLDVDASLQCSEVIDPDLTDSNYDRESGEWISFWDSFYMRYYFCNIKTHESTWDPPPGMEHLVSGEVIENPYEMVDESLNSVHLSTEHLNGRINEMKHLGCGEVSSKDLLLTDTNGTEEQVCSGYIDNSETIVSSEEIQSMYHVGSAFQPSNASGFSSDFIKELSEDNWNGKTLTEPIDPATDKLETEHNSVSGKPKKLARKRTRVNRKSSGDSGELQFQGILEELSPSMNKYWCQRYSLFSRFDDGIRMDEEGWFSVTPELIARHHAVRCGNGIIVDCFTGVGGNAIQFAQRSKHVIAIDIDPRKIDYAQHNATIYGVDDRIEFIRGDSFLLSPRLKADTVFLSPPWGGPDYVKATKYDIKAMLKPCDGHVLFNMARGIASKVVMFLPRNVDLNQLAELALSVNPPWSLEVEKNYLNGKLKAITAYFSDT